MTKPKDSCSPLSEKSCILSEVRHCYTEKCQKNIINNSFAYLSVRKYCFSKFLQPKILKFYVCSNFGIDWHIKIKFALKSLEIQPQTFIVSSCLASLYLRLILFVIFQSESLNFVVIWTTCLLLTELQISAKFIEIIIYSH